jgi:hypothetical protein
MKISLDGSVTGDTVLLTMTKTHDNIPRIGNWPTHLKMPPLRRKPLEDVPEVKVTKTRTTKVQAPKQDQPAHSLWDMPEGDF